MRARLQAVTDWLNLTRRSRYDPASLAAACRVTPRTLELYTYDGIGQLKVADSSVSSENRGYAFDHCWNMNWCTNNGTANNYLVDTKNEVTNAYGATYSYDSNGNLTTGTNGSNAYVYDDENRLIQWFWYNNGTNCTGGGYRTDFFYDGLGRLRKRLEYSIPPTPGGAGAPPPSMQCVWNLNTEVYYIYDGMRVIQERDGSNNPLVAYTRGTDLSGTLEGAGGIGGLLARSDGYSGGNFTNHSYYHADGNGNITYLENSSQGLAATYRYDAYGNTVSTGGPLANGNVYRFSSKECHTNSGMYYFLHRFYHPNLQRWLNRDPKGEMSDPNLYRSFRNSPIEVVDPFGEITLNGCLCYPVPVPPAKPGGCTIKCHCIDLSGKTTDVIVDLNFAQCALWFAFGPPVKILPVPSM